MRHAAPSEGAAPSACAFHKDSKQLLEMSGPKAYSDLVKGADQWRRASVSGCHQAQSRRACLTTLGAAPPLILSSCFLSLRKVQALHLLRPTKALVTARPVLQRMWSPSTADVVLLAARLASLGKSHWTHARSARAVQLACSFSTPPAVFVLWACFHPAQLLHACMTHNPHIHSTAIG